MFVLRSLFWLTSVVLLLPPATDGETSSPRVSLLHTAYATQILLQDLTGVCDRNPEACEISREALALLSGKLETGADIVVAGISAGGDEADLLDPEALGTLTPDDLQPAWALAAARP